MNANPFAVVTGASTGIGFELAKCCAHDGYDLLICADEPEIEQAAEALRGETVEVETLIADLGTKEGTGALSEAIAGRPVDALLANAGRGLGDAFLDEHLDKAVDVIDLNVVSTIALIHDVGRQMRARGSGKILITGSVAGFMPGSYQAVYNGTKAFLDSFSWALRNELKESGVTVTCLMPGPTETEFFNRAGMQDTKIGSSDDKDDPAKVARQGYEAMEEGVSGVTVGFMNKVQTTFAGIIPDSVLAEMHRRMAEPQ